MADGSVQFIIEVDDSGAIKSLKKFEKEAAKTGSESGKKIENSFLSGFGSIKSVVSGLGASILAGLAVEKVIGAAARQQDAINNLNASLKRIGEFSQQTSQDLQNFASELQSVTKFGDEAVLEQLALAQGFGATADQSKRIVTAAADLSAALGIDLNAATRNISKTLGGLTGELGEVIPELKGFTQEQLKSGAAIDLIANKFQNLAQAEVQTFSGALEQLKNSFGDLLEAFGGIVTESSLVTKAIQGLSTSFQNAAGFVKLFFNATNEQQLDSVDQDIISLTQRINELKAVASGKVERGFIDSLFGDDVRNIGDLEKSLETLKAKRQEIINQQTQVNASNLSSAVSLSEFQIQLQKLNFTQQESASAVTAFGQALNTTNQSAFLPVLESIKQLGLSQEETKKALRDPEFIQSVQAGNQQISLSFGTLVDSFKAQAKTVQVLNKDIAKSFINTLGRGVGQAFSAFGAALVNGENAFSAFGKVILGLLGDISIQLGTGFILQGTARLLAGDPGGGALIGAGAALATFGGVLKALGGGGSSLGGGGAPSAGGGGIATNPSDAQIFSSSQQNISEPGTAVNVTIQGDVLDSNESGTRIVGILNDAFDKQGVVVSNNARFA